MTTINVDGFYPASQFHFSLSDTPTAEQKERIMEAIQRPMSGLVDIKWTPRRVIITTAHGPDERDEWGNEFKRRIESVF